MADRRLQVFHAVAKHGSFTRAAEHLFMTQPAVTFQIKQLEEHYNTRLFERGHGKIALTPAGEIVMAYAERILDLNEELETRVSELTDELTGTLNIGTSTTIAAYWLPSLLRDFKLHYPRVVPRVVVGNSQLIEDRLLYNAMIGKTVGHVLEQEAVFGFTRPDRLFAQLQVPEQNARGLDHSGNHDRAVDENDGCQKKQVSQ